MDQSQAALKAKKEQLRVSTLDEWDRVRLSLREICGLDKKKGA